MAAIKAAASDGLPIAGVPASARATMLLPDNYSNVCTPSISISSSRRQMSPCRIMNGRLAP